MALSIDIKANDAFEKSALAAAAALEKTAKHEQNVDAMAKRIASSYKDAAVSAKDMAKYTEAYGKRTEKTYGASEKIAQVGKKDRAAMLAQVNKAYAVEKKVVDKEKEQEKLIKKGAIAYAAVTGAIVASVAAVGALGVAIGVSAKGAFDAKRNAAALLDAFTARRGPQALQMLDGLATKLGQSFGDVRQQFVEFRQAGLSNALSAKLIKMRADLIAVGLSAEAADKEISFVTSAADGLGNVAAQRRMAELSRAYGGVGSGAKAAAFALTSVSAAENKIGNVVSEKLAGLWEKIGPAIGKAANQLADFAVKLINSDKGQAAIEGIANAFIKVAGAVGPALDGLGKVFDVLSENKIAVVTGLTFAVGALGVAIVSAFGPAIVAATGAALAFAALPLAVAAAAVGVGLAVQAIVKHWDVIEDIAKAAYRWGSDIVTGLVDGIKAKVSSAVDSVKGLAGDIAGAFTKALGIQSPSKLFAEYGRNTVAGFEKGESEAIARSTAMPLQEAAAEPVATPAPRGATSTPSGGSSAQAGGGRGGLSVVIEQLNVQGGGDPEAIAIAIRRELTALLMSGELSRGLA